MAITIRRGSDLIFSDRYKYDFKLLTYANGWAQIDTTQDASYYGTWTNPERRELFNYCEGDTTLTVCDTEDDYLQAVRECAEWNKERGYWLGIDAHGMREPFEALGLSDLLH
jgi:hypothetical protein